MVLKMKGPDNISRRLFTKGGTDQISRFSPLLKKDAIKIDLFSLKRQISITAAFARAVAFYNSDNLVDGDWEFLYTSDETLLMGLIAGMNAEHLKSLFQDTDLRLSETAQYDLCVTLAARIDIWYKKFAAIDSPVGKRMHDLIHTVISDRLRNKFHGLTRLNINSHDFTAFDTVWTKSASQDPDLSFDDDKILLKHVFYALINAITRI